MSASLRPISASPRSSVNVFVTLPASPMSDRRGPPEVRSTLTDSSGVMRMLIDTRCPTRLPHRAQKTSSPLTYSAPHWLQLLVRPSATTLDPQWPQNGNVGSTVLAHFGQVLSSE